MADPLTNGFRSERQLRNHFEKHKDEYGVGTVYDYLSLADQFLGSELKGWMKECHCSVCDDTLRYDKRSQDFGVICLGYIVTFYRLEKGSNQRNEAYFDRECSDQDCQGMST